MSAPGTDPRPADCLGCRHFWVTWDPLHPRGCRAYGFKSVELPSLVVLGSSGTPCLQFEPKPRPATAPRPEPPEGGLLA